MRDTTLAPLDREALSQAMDWLKAYIVSYSGEDLEGFCDETIALAELCVDTERGTGAPEMLRSEEELRQDEELDQVTFEYIEALLSRYRVVYVSD